MLRILIILSLLVACIAPAYADSPAKPAASASADVPLDKPGMDDAGILVWATTAAADAMTFNHHDYQRRLQQSSRHFTRAGWESFAAAMQRSRIIEEATAQHETVSAQPKEPPLLIQEGTVEGIYQWTIQMPLAVSHKGLAQEHTDTLRLALVIKRVASTKNSSAIGIAQWSETRETDKIKVSPALSTLYHFWSLLNSGQ